VVVVEQIRPERGTNRPDFTQHPVMPFVSDKLTVVVPKNHGTHRGRVTSRPAPTGDKQVEIPVAIVIRRAKGRVSHRPGGQQVLRLGNAGMVQSQRRAKGQSVLVIALKHQQAPRGGMESENSDLIAGAHLAKRRDGGFFETAVRVV